MNGIKPLALRSIRSRLEWTQAEMATILGVSRSHYNGIECGREQVNNTHTIRKIILDNLVLVVQAGRADDLIAPDGDDVELLTLALTALFTVAQEVRDA